jgi:hypothetical protein
VCHIASIYLVADGWYWLCVGTARQAADPGVRVEMPLRVLGSRGIGVSRERRAWAGGGFPVHAGGSSVEATDRHPPGGWAKGRSTCLCR